MKIFKKAAVILALSALFAAGANAEEAAPIKSADLQDGVLYSVSADTEADAAAIAAIYDADGRMIKAVFADSVKNGVYGFSGGVVIPEGAKLKLMLWEMADGKISVKPLGAAYVPVVTETPVETEAPTVEPTVEPSAVPTTEPTVEPSAEPSAVPTSEPIGDGIIHLLGDSINADGVAGVSVDGTVLTISEAGDYTIEGSLNEGQIIVTLSDSKAAVNLTLNGVNVTNSADDAFKGTCGKVTLIPAKNTSSSFKSSGESGCGIYSKNDLTVKGEGYIEAISEYGNGIRCKKDIEIGVCDLYVKAGNNGIKGDESVKITKKNRSVTVEANGDAIKSDTAPVYDTDGVTLLEGGTVTINGGVINLTAKTETDAATGEIKYGDGIQADCLLAINGGEISITAEGDGMNCSMGNVEITDGAITVNAQQDCIQSDYSAIISGGKLKLKAYTGAPANPSSSTTTANSTKGIKGGNLVKISGGELDINSYDDAIHSNNTVLLSGGVIYAASGDDGVHADSYLYIRDDAELHVTKSYEGIEAAKIYVEGGKSYVVSTDDGANGAGEEPTTEPYFGDEVTTAAYADVVELNGPGGGGNWGGNQGPNWGQEDSSNYGYIEVSGGLLYIEAEGDGFDSNGSAVISGGTVLVNGPTKGGNGVFDIGDGANCTLKVTGGTLVGAGIKDMAVTPNSFSDSQYYVCANNISTQSAGKAFRLTDNSGNELITYVPSKSYGWVLVSSPELAAGNYTLSYGGSVSGGTYTVGNYGIVEGGAFSGGSNTTLNATK